MPPEMSRNSLCSHDAEAAGGCGLRGGRSSGRRVSRWPSMDESARCTERQPITYTGAVWRPRGAGRRTSTFAAGQLPMLFAVSHVGFLNLLLRWSARWWAAGAWSGAGRPRPRCSTAIGCRRRPWGPAAAPHSCCCRSRWPGRQSRAGSRSVAPRASLLRCPSHTQSSATLVAIAPHRCCVPLSDAPAVW